MKLIGLGIFAAGLFFVATVRGQIAESSIELPDAASDKSSATLLRESSGEPRTYGYPYSARPTRVPPVPHHLMRPPYGLRTPLNGLENPSSPDVSPVGPADKSLVEPAGEVPDEIRSYRYSYMSRPTQAPPVPPYIMRPPFGLRSNPNVLHQEGLRPPNSYDVLKGDCKICDGYVECGKSNAFPSCTNVYPCTENEYKICEKLIGIENSTACDRPGIFPDPKSPKRYFSCDIEIKQYEFGITKKVHKCSGLTSYDSTTMRCLTEFEKLSLLPAIQMVVTHQNKTVIKCKKPGVYPYPGDCKLYYKCGSGPEPALFSCPKFEYFDGYVCSGYRSNKCTMDLVSLSLKEKMEADMIYYWMKLLQPPFDKDKPPAGSVMPPSKLPYEGALSYPCPYTYYSARDPLSKNCNKYYICIDVSDNGGHLLTPLIRSCKPGMYFSNEMHVCVHNKPADC